PHRGSAVAAPSSAAGAAPTGAGQAGLNKVSSQTSAERGAAQPVPRMPQVGQPTPPGSRVRAREREPRGLLGRAPEVNSHLGRRKAEPAPLAPEGSPNPGLEVPAFTVRPGGLFGPEWLAVVANNSELVLCALDLRYTF